MQEALLVLGHLNAKGLLCSMCGHRWATESNSYHTVCGACKGDFPNMTFTQVPKKGSSLDRILCQRLSVWVATVVQGDEQALGNASDSKGNK